MLTGGIIFVADFFHVGKPPMPILPILCVCENSNEIKWLTALSHSVLKIILYELTCTLVHRMISCMKQKTYQIRDFIADCHGQSKSCRPLH